AVYIFVTLLFPLRPPSLPPPFPYTTLFRSTELGLLDDLETTSGGLRSYALVPDRSEACLPADTDEDGTPVLLCDECRETVTGTSAVLTPLQDGPCPRHRCPGTLRARTLNAT